MVDNERWKVADRLTTVKRAKAWAKNLSGRKIFRPDYPAAWEPPLLFAADQTIRLPGGVGAASAVRCRPDYPTIRLPGVVGITNQRKIR